MRGWSATLPLGLFQGERDSRTVLTTSDGPRIFKSSLSPNLCFHLAMWRMRLPWLSSILFSQFQKGVC